MDRGDRLLDHPEGRVLLVIAPSASPGAARGISLIELMITIAIAVILTLMAAPVYRTWVASQQIRTATESLLDGMRVAQTEAIKRNADVQFVLEGADGWKVEVVSDATVLRAVAMKEGSPKVTYTVDPLGTDTFRFNGLGRVLDKDANAFASRVTIDVTSSAGISGARALRVVVDTAAATGVAIKSCDPHLATTDPRGCPSTS
ncbi:MAG: GspH/FimT family pseudopilin [Burkholderiales bacterium]